MKLLAWAFTLLASALTLTGCDGSGRPQNSTDVRAVHAAADVEPLDFLVDDEPRASAIAFGNASPYANFLFGSRTVKARSSTTGAILAEASGSFGPNGFYTVFFHGRPGAVAALVVNEDAGLLPAERIRGRLIALAPDAPALDLYLASTGDITTANPSQVGVIYPGVGGYVDTAAGRYSVVLTVSGTREVVYQSSPRDFASGTKFSVAAIATPSGRLVGALLLPTKGEVVPLASTLSRVRALNARSGSGPLNFRADGATLFASVPFAASSDYLVTASGARALRSELSSVPGTTAGSLDTTFTASRDHTVIATGTQAAPRLVVLNDDNRISTAAGTARVRLVNLRTDGVSANASVAGASQANLAPESASAYLTVPSGSAQTVEFTVPGSPTVVASLAVTFELGSVNTLYLLGSGSTLSVRAVRDR